MNSFKSIGNLLAHLLKFPNLSFIKKNYALSRISKFTGDPSQKNKTTGSLF